MWNLNRHVNISRIQKSHFHPHNKIYEYLPELSNKIWGQTLCIEVRIGVRVNILLGIDPSDQIVPEPRCCWVFNPLQSEFCGPSHFFVTCFMWKVHLGMRVILLTELGPSIFFFVVLGVSNNVVWNKTLKGPGLLKKPCSPY